MAEQRLIDANAMRQDWLENGENECVYDTNAVLDSIDAQPTVDAVEVVRCEDCKSYCRIIGKGDRAIFGCSYMGRDIKPDDFCSYGERRTDG